MQSIKPHVMVLAINDLDDHSLKDRLTEKHYIRISLSEKPLLSLSLFSLRASTLVALSHSNSTIYCEFVFSNMFAIASCHYYLLTIYYKYIHILLNHMRKGITSHSYLVFSPHTRSYIIQVLVIRGMCHNLLFSVHILPPTDD